MNKKIIIGIIAAIVVIGGTVGTVLGVQAYNTNKEYEELANTATECEKMIQNMNYCYSEETDECKQARQNDLNTLKTFKEEIESKDMTDEQKSEFSEFCKNLKKKYEDDKNQTKGIFDGILTTKNNHTEEGYYIDDFNNEWIVLVDQFNQFYDNEQYFEAFKVIQNMRTKLNDYILSKDKEAADKAEAEKQEADKQKAQNNSNNSNSDNKSKKSNITNTSNDASANEQNNNVETNNIPSESQSNSHEGYKPDDVRPQNEEAIKRLREQGWTATMYDSLGNKIDI